MEAPSLGGWNAMLSEAASSKLSSRSEVAAEVVGDASMPDAKKTGRSPGLRGELGEAARPNPRGRGGSSRCWSGIPARSLLERKGRRPCMECILQYLGIGMMVMMRKGSQIDGEPRQTSPDRVKSDTRWLQWRHLVERQPLGCLGDPHPSRKALRGCQVMMMSLVVERDEERRWRARVQDSFAKRKEKRVFLLLFGGRL